MEQAGLDALTSFLRVAQTRSFTAAANLLGQSVSATSYTIRELEKKLDVRLFNRTTRSVSLTEAGAQFLQRIAPLLEDLQLAMSDVADATRSTSGTLRLNMPQSASSLLLQPLLGEFLRAYPNISLEVGVENSLIDIAGKGYDAGIRYDDVLTGDMMSVPLRTGMHYVVAAAPGYLAEHGTPAHPRDLLKHDCINYRSAGSGALYRWEFRKGKEQLQLDVKGRLASNDSNLMLQAALDGLGLLYLPDLALAAHLASGALVQVLAQWSPPCAMYLYYFNRSRMPKKLRVFIDFMRERQPG